MANSKKKPLKYKAYGKSKRKRNLTVMRPWWLRMLGGSAAGAATAVTSTRIAVPAKV